MGSLIRTRCRRWFAAAVLALGVIAPARPAVGLDLFSILVVNTDGMGIPDLTVGGSSLPTLINELVASQGAFAVYAGAAFDANVTYAGVANAIRVQVDPIAMTATLSFPILGPAGGTFVFTGADLQAQVEAFLQDAFADQVQAFLQKINTLSLVAVTDGSPISTTAISSNYVFQRFGMHVDQTSRELWEGNLSDEKLGLRGRVDAYYDRVGTDVANGHSFAITPSMEYLFDERFSLALLGSITYHQLGGSDIFNFSGTLAAPIYLLPPDGEEPLSVRVTPFATIAGAGSVDLLAGGLIGSVGVLGTAAWRIGDLLLSMSAQVSHHDGLPLSYQGFEFDPGVDQRITKTGIKLSHLIGEDKFVYGSMTLTTFLQPAAIDEYLSPGAGFGLRADNGFNFTVGYSSDIADGYNSHQLRMNFQLPF